MAQCLHQAGAAFDHLSYQAASYSGNVAMVRWLAHEVGASARGVSFVALVGRWPRKTAADGRDLLEAVQLLVGAGCSVWAGRDADRMARLLVGCAAGRGDLVQYLLTLAQQQQQEQQQLLPAGCGLLDRETVKIAALSGCEAQLEWLVEQHPGCLTGPGGGDCPYVLAAANGDRCTLEVLRRLGVAWGPRGVVAQAVREGCRAPVLRWLVEQGAPVGSEKEVEAAVERAVEERAIGEGTATWLRGLVAAAAPAGLNG